MSVLFYSKNCKNCLEFLKKLKEENMLKYFEEYFCIDGKRSLPPFLHSVPTIIVSDSEKPLVGDDAFNWLTFKMDQKYKSQELGSFGDGGGNFVNIGDPNNINLDSTEFISIENIDKPIKPDYNTQEKFNNAETMNVAKRMEIIQQERAQFASSQKGITPQQPNFQR